MAIEFEYNETLAVDADAAASRINEGGAYVGKFVKVSAITARSGAQGMEFMFHAPGNGEVTFTLYTEKEGRALFGASFVNAMMFLMGLRTLKSASGMVSVYDEGVGGRVDVEGDVFPALCEKPIGIVLQKELYTTEDGMDRSRISLIGLYQPETKLTMTEIKERKTTPVKLDRLLKNLKVKDSRKKTAEVAQPALGGVANGDF